MRDKPALRAWAQQRRATLDMAALSASLCTGLRALPEFAAAHHVLLYLAMPGEVNIEYLIDEDPARRWYAPRCATKRRLAVHAYRPGETPLCPGPFGIREPDPALVPEIDATGTLDMVMVPGLLFSERGERLGYGGGYYDRFLPRLTPDCLRVGATPDALILPELPTDPWDQPLDIVVTETRILRVARP